MVQSQPSLQRRNSRRDTSSDSPQASKPGPHHFLPSIASKAGGATRACAAAASMWPQWEAETCAAAPLLRPWVPSELPPHALQEPARKPGSPGAALRNGTTTLTPRLLSGRQLSGRLQPSLTRELLGGCSPGRPHSGSWGAAASDAPHAGHIQGTALDSVDGGGRSIPPVSLPLSSPASLGSSSCEDSLCGDGLGLRAACPAEIPKSQQQGRPSKLAAHFQVTTPPLTAPADDAAPLPGSIRRRHSSSSGCSSSSMGGGSCSQAEREEALHSPVAPTLGGPASRAPPLSLSSEGTAGLGPGQQGAAGDPSTMQQQEYPGRQGGCTRQQEAQGGQEGLIPQPSIREKQKVKRQRSSRKKGHAGSSSAAAKAIAKGSSSSGTNASSRSSNSGSGGASASPVAHSAVVPNTGSGNVIATASGPAQSSPLPHLLAWPAAMVAAASLAAHGSVSGTGRPYLPPLHVGLQSTPTRPPSKPRSATPPVRSRPDSLLLLQPQAMGGGSCLHSPAARQRSLSVGRPALRPSVSNTLPRAAGCGGGPLLLPPLAPVDWQEEQRRTQDRLDAYRRAREDTAKQAAEEEASRRRQSSDARAAQKLAKERHREEVYALNAVLRM